MSLIRRLSRRFSRRGSRPYRRRQDYSDGKSHDKDSIACKVNLLDGTVLSFDLEVSLKANINNLKLCIDVSL